MLCRMAMLFYSALMFNIFTRHQVMSGVFLRIISLGDIMRKIKCFSLMFLIGGIGYNLIEILWRGYTHVSMFFAGGICFNAFAAIGKNSKNHKPFFLAAIGALMVTAVEFITGCIVNLWLKKKVWDYSKMPFNILGQICPVFTLLWGLLSLFAIPFSAKIHKRLSK